MEEELQYIFSAEHTEVGMVVYAYVDSYDTVAAFEVIDKQRHEGNPRQYKVKLQASGGEESAVRIWTLFLEDDDVYFLDACESDQDKDRYLEKTKNVRMLTGVQSSHDDAWTVFEAMTGDIGVCARVSLNPDRLQTRSKTYSR